MEVVFLSIVGKNKFYVIFVKKKILVFENGFFCRIIIENILNLIIVCSICL